MRSYLNCDCSTCRRFRRRAARKRNRLLSIVASVCVLVLCGIILAYIAMGGGP
jgi:hypothetical protein